MTARLFFTLVAKTTCLAISCPMMSALGADLFPNKAPLPAPGSLWTGTATNAELAKFQVTGPVLSAQGDQFTLRTNLDNGAVWEWTFKVKNEDLEIISFKRVRASQGNKNPGGTANVRGSGSLKNGVLKFRYTWPQPENNKTARGSFELKAE